MKDHLTQCAGPCMSSVSSQIENHHLPATPPSPTGSKFALYLYFRALWVPGEKSRGNCKLVKKSQEGHSLTEHLIPLIHLPTW
jgi:hypothetical protein